MTPCSRCDPVQNCTGRAAVRLTRSSGVCALCKPDDGQSTARPAAVLHTMICHHRRLAVCVRLVSGRCSRTLTLLLYCVAAAQPDHTQHGQESGGVPGARGHDGGAVHGARAGRHGAQCGGAQAAFVVPHSSACVHLHAFLQPLSGADFDVSASTSMVRAANKVRFWVRDRVRVRFKNEVKVKVRARVVTHVTGQTGVALQCFVSNQAHLHLACTY